MTIHDPRRAVLSKFFNVSEILDGNMAENDNCRYAMAVMIKLMSEAGFCGSEFDREPVIQLETVLERLTGFGMRKLAELKAELKMAERKNAAYEDVLFEEMDLHDHQVRALPNGVECQEHNERAMKIRGTINSFNPKFKSYESNVHNENYSGNL